MLKYTLIFFLFFFVSIQISAQALEHKPKQMFISPEISLGTPFIINQNNYGYTEMGNDLTFGYQIGVMLGWDYFLKKSMKTGLLLSKWGQHYSEVINDKSTKKKVNNFYLQIPITYKHVFGRKRGYDHEVYSPYVLGGMTVGWLFYSNVEYSREQEGGSFQEESLVDFVTEGGWNLNTEEIIAQGNPKKDKNLFSPLDINIHVGAGYLYFITRRISLFAEAQISTSLLDINAGDWRFRDENNVYRASYNLYPALKFGANIYLYKNRR